MSVDLALLWHWLLRETGRAASGPDLHRWVVVDTETSGLDPQRDRLLAIGGVAVDDGAVVVDDSFEVVVQCDTTSDAKNVAVHGIGQVAQASGVPAVEAIGAFRDWAADAPRVGFHADFDRKVLRTAFASAGIEGDDCPWLDLAPLAAALQPDEQSRRDASLDDWLVAFGIECTFRHNAASDALATAELLLRLRALAAAQGTRGFDALVKASRQQKWLGNVR